MSGKSTGMGLGLAVSRAIAEAHGGALEAPPVGARRIPPGSAMRAAGLTVYVVDDDASVRDSLALMLSLSGYKSALFADAESFLAAWRAALGRLRARRPAPAGKKRRRAAGRAARESAAALPFVIITAHGDVATARAAFQAAGRRLPREALRQRPAARRDRDRLRAGEALRLRRSAEAARSSTRLTAREREVLEHAAQGLHAKEIAARLGISPRTVEVHKTRIMEKLGVRNVAELVRFALAAAPRKDD